MKALVLTLCLFVLLAASAPAPDMSGCTVKGIQLHGKVKVVTSFADLKVQVVNSFNSANEVTTSFADLKVQVVNSFPDLKVQEVNSFPDTCGKWQFVDSFPDFTIQYVSSFPDIKVRFVNSFPGVP